MRLLLALAALAAPTVPAAEPAPLTIETGGTPVVLAGRDAARQLVVTGTTDGRPRDLTRQATYTVSPPGVVAVDAGGCVTP